MPYGGLQGGAWGVLAHEMLAKVRRDAASNAFVEPFMRNLPKTTGLGVHDHVAQMQMELVCEAYVQKIVEIIAPYEWWIRAILDFPPGDRKIEFPPDYKPPRGRWVYLLSQLLRGRWPF